VLYSTLRAVAHTSPDVVVAISRSIVSFFDTRSAALDEAAAALARLGGDGGSSGASLSPSDPFACLAYVQLALAVGVPNVATLALEQWQRRRPPTVSEGRMPYGVTPLNVTRRAGGLAIEPSRRAAARLPVHAVWLLLRTRRAPFEGALDALTLLDLLHEQVMLLLLLLFCIVL
jgi:hypothetical protein